MFTLGRFARGVDTMTTELTYLAYTAMLGAALWIVYIAAQVQTNGFLVPQNYKDPTPRPVPYWGMRANRAQLNMVESFAPFAVLVLVLHVTNQNNSTTAFLAMAFFWLRLVHAIVYWFAVPYIRTIVFTLGFLCVVGLFWQVVT
jgi:uncharacterized MAPEG superfamily protein